MKNLFLAISLFFCFQIVLADTIQPISNGSWQSTAIWPGGQLPGESDDVIIPEGYVVFLGELCT